MKKPYSNLPNGYQETIQKGIDGLPDFSGGMLYGPGDPERELHRLKDALETADAIVIGAGAGLSTAAGHVYDGERFERYFADFREAFGFKDMYSGGFFPFPDEETRWAFWSRQIYFNRYCKAPGTAYDDLLSLMEGRDYFVITTNVDHQFQLAGFPEEKVFATQGDYGLWQRAYPRATATGIRLPERTVPNEEAVCAMMEAQGFVRDGAGAFTKPQDGKVSLRIPTELVPKDPADGCPLVMNLRSDDTFLEDEDWHRASAAYSEYLAEKDGQKVLFLEMGVGGNTPVIIKYPFWQMTRENPRATYACLNYSQAFTPELIHERSIVIDGDTQEVLRKLR